MSKIRIKNERPSMTMLLGDLEQKSYFQLKKYETIFIKLSDIHQDMINNSEKSKNHIKILDNDIYCLCIASIKKENYSTGSLIALDELTEIVPIKKSSFVIHQ